MIKMQLTLVGLENVKLLQSSGEHDKPLNLQLCSADSFPSISMSSPTTYLGS